MLFHAFQADNSNCRREQRCGSDRFARPGDIFHPDLIKDDCSDKFSAAIISCSSGHTMLVLLQSHGEQGKDNHHESHVTAASRVFDPLICESLSLWSPHCHHVIKAIS